MSGRSLNGRRRPPPPRAVFLEDGSVAVEDAGVISRRDTEMLRCIAAGMTTREIAASFGISADAIDKAVQRLLLTFALPNRTALAALWAELALLSGERRVG